MDHGAVREDDPGCTNADLPHPTSSAVRLHASAVVLRDHHPIARSLCLYRSVQSRSSLELEFRHLNERDKSPMPLLFVIAVLLLFAAWDLLHR
jgi:hypothetical protein